MNAVLSFLLDVLTSWVAFALGVLVLLACVLASTPVIEEADEHEHHHL